MHFKEYILPLWYFAFSIIFLLFGLYCFLYRMLVARKFKDKKRIKERGFRSLYFFLLPVILILLALYDSNNANVFSAIIALGSGFYLYDYDFILNEGLLINGKYILWNNIHSWDYKNNKDILILKYFKNSNDKKLSKVKFNIISSLRFEFEIMLKDKVNNKNIKNEDKVYSNKIIKIGLSLSLIIVTMVSVYGFYNLLQPKPLAEVLEKTFNYKETDWVLLQPNIRPRDNDGALLDMYITSKQGKLKEMTNYLNSFNVRKILLKNSNYSFFSIESYEITLYGSNQDTLNISICKKKPIIEIRSGRKKRIYFIDKNDKYLEFINKFMKNVK